MDEAVKEEAADNVKEVMHHLPSYSFLSDFRWSAITDISGLSGPKFIIVVASADVVHL